MSPVKFAELCEGTAGMLKALAQQSGGVTSPSGEMKFDKNVAGETIVPLAEIIMEISKAAC